MKPKMISGLGLMSGALLLAGAASANVFTVSYYRLGEQDPGAVGGGLAHATAVDSGGASVNLSQIGTMNSAYSTNSGVAGSTLSVAINGGGYANALPFQLLDNWGMEAWVYSTNADSGTGILVNNGANCCGSGMALVQNGGVFQGVCSGIAYVGSTPVTTETWTHLALVTSGGTTTLYVNGVANGTAGAPSAPTADRYGVGFSIGNCMNGSGSPQPFRGLIDEVRVFTFAEGEFSTADLLLANVPPPPQAPVIVAGPTAVPANSVSVGDALTLSVLSGGTGPVRFQWWQGTTRVPGATNAALAFTSVTTDMAGNYSVVVSNAYGATTSAVVNITVYQAGTGLFPSAYYRLGENDPGATDGQAANTATVDIVSGMNLSQSGTPPTYSSRTGVRGSSLSMAFSGGSYQYSTPLITNAARWGMEAWVYSTNADIPMGIIVNNGANCCGTGMAIVQHHGVFQGLCSGIAYVGSTPVVINTWTHLALVTSGGMTTFYVNGVANGTAGAPNTPTVDPYGIGFSIGDCLSGQGAPQPFQGLIDEVRMFTFSPGLFATNSLLLTSVPPGPASVSLLPTGGKVPGADGHLILVWNTGLWGGANVQQASTLSGPWNLVPQATSPWLIPAGGASQFFRLVRP